MEQGFLTFLGAIKTLLKLIYVRVDEGFWREQNLLYLLAPLGDSASQFSLIPSEDISLDRRLPRSHGPEQNPKELSAAQKPIYSVGQNVGNNALLHDYFSPHPPPPRSYYYVQYYVHNTVVVLFLLSPSVCSTSNSSLHPSLLWDI